MRRYKFSFRIEHLSGGNSMSQLGYEIITIDVHSLTQISLRYMFVILS